MTRMRRPSDLIARTTWQVETDLSRSTSLAGMAARLGISPFHLTRAFALATGQSLMAYIRARRLTEAARALADRAASVTETAFDAGYDSVDGFTRAFRDRFGLTPSAFRARPVLSDLALQEPIAMSQHPAADLSPRFETTGPLRLVGVSDRFDLQTRARIPALWDRVVGEYGDRMTGHETFGVCHDFAEDGSFSYLVGWPADPMSDRAGLALLDVPAGRYAVFEHTGHIGTISETWSGIFTNWAPASGCTLREGPELERYAPDFDPAQPGGVSVWIPVAA